MSEERIRSGNDPEPEELTTEQLETLAGGAKEANLKQQASEEREK